MEIKTMTKTQIKIMKQIETVVRGNGFEFEWNGEDPISYAFLGGYNDIETAPNYDDLCADLDEIDGVKYDTEPGDNGEWGCIEFWIN